MEILKAVSIRKEYENRFTLNVHNLAISEGEILTCVGPNGSGKSTLVRILSLIEKPDAGFIFFRGKEIQDLKGRERLRVLRKMTVVFQDPVFFAGSVFDNVAAGLDFRGLSSKTINREVQNALKLAELDGLADADVSSLSAGEAQKVAFARSIALDTDLIFLDEPFSNLDPQNRKSFQAIVRNVLRSLGRTAFLVTHDISEAAYLGDRVAVINDGSIAQVGPPSEVLFKPANAFIARFTGMENLFEGRVLSSSGGVISVQVDGGVIQAAGEEKAGTRVILGLRGEDIGLVPPEQISLASSYRNSFEAIIERIEPSGGIVRVFAKCPFSVVAYVTSRSATELGIVPGNKVGIRFKATSVHVIGSSF